MWVKIKYLSSDEVRPVALDVRLGERGLEMSQSNRVEEYRYI